MKFLSCGLATLFLACSATRVNTRANNSLISGEMQVLESRFETNVEINSNKTQENRVPGIAPFPFCKEWSTELFFDVEDQTEVPLNEVIMVPVAVGDRIEVGAYKKRPIHILIPAHGKISLLVYDKDTISRSMTNANFARDSGHIKAMVGPMSPTSVRFQGDVVTFTGKAYYLSEKTKGKVGSEIKVAIKTGHNAYIDQIRSCLKYAISAPTQAADGVLPDGGLRVYLVSTNQEMEATDYDNLNMIMKTLPISNIVAEPTLASVSLPIKKLTGSDPHVICFAQQEADLSDVPMLGIQMLESHLCRRGYSYLDGASFWGKTGAGIGHLALSCVAHESIAHNIEKTKSGYFHKKSVEKAQQKLTHALQLKGASYGIFSYKGFGDVLAASIHLDAKKDKLRKKMMKSIMKDLDALRPKPKAMFVYGDYNLRLYREDKRKQKTNFKPKTIGDFTDALVDSTERAKFMADNFCAGEEFIKSYGLKTIKVPGDAWWSYKFIEKDDNTCEFLNDHRYNPYAPVVPITSYNVQLTQSELKQKVMGCYFGRTWKKPQKCKSQLLGGKCKINKGDPVLRSHFPMEKDKSKYIDGGYLDRVGYKSESGAAVTPMRDGERWGIFLRKFDHSLTASMYKITTA